MDYFLRGLIAFLVIIVLPIGLVIDRWYISRKEGKRDESGSPKDVRSYRDVESHASREPSRGTEEQID